MPQYGTGSPEVEEMAQLLFAKCIVQHVPTKNLVSVNQNIVSRMTSQFDSDYHTKFTGQSQYIVTGTISM